MPWRNSDAIREFALLVFAFASMISGGAGGMLVAGAYTLRGRVDTFAMALAHVVVGMGVGFGVAAVSPIIPGVSIASMSDALLMGFLLGLVASVFLGACQIALRIGNRLLGNLEIDVRITGIRDGDRRTRSGDSDE